MTAPTINRRILIPSAIVISVWPLSTAFNTMIMGQSMVIDNSNTMYITTFGGKNSSTSATNAIKFAFSSGNLSTGQIRFYGIT